LAEFGLVFPQKPADLREALPDVLEDAPNELGGSARVAPQRAQAQWAELVAHLAWCDERIAAHLKADPQAAHAQQLMGLGPVGASAAVASVGDLEQFRHGSQLSVRLGLTPRQTPAVAKTTWGAPPAGVKRICAPCSFRTPSWPRTSPLMRAM
jgi:transposase